jgi:hypothetical protein
VDPDTAGHLGFMDSFFQQLRRLHAAFLKIIKIPFYSGRIFHAPEYTT